MSERMTERLNRLIDGDLTPAESDELRRGVETDPALRRELDGLRRVRQSLHELATREHPPAELDALVDPLLRGKPEAGTGSQWARWMAAAAVVVLGVTVVLEVQRRQPDPALVNWQERALAGAAAEPTQGFSLAPLPTHSESETRPRGAVDRLVAAPETGVDAAVEPAPALEVLGPLSSGSVNAKDAGNDRRLDTSLDKSGTRVDAHDPPAAVSRPSQSSVTSAKSAGEPAPSDTDGSASAPERGGRHPEPEASEVTIAGAQLFVFMQSETAWRAFEPDRPCEAGRYALRVRIKDGVITEVWPVANPPAPTRQVRASQLVLGLEVNDVADGEYSAEVVVEPRRPTSN